MPIVIVVDVSLSMMRPVTILETGEVFQRQHLAIHGINTILDYLAVHSKLEFVALVAFSSLCEIVSPFTRDFDLIKSKLQQLEEFDQTCVETALHGVNTLVLDEWGSLTPCQFILVTDGTPGVGSHSLKNSLSSLNQRDAATPFPVPFSFPAKLSVMCIASHDDAGLQVGLPLYQKLVDLSGGEGGVYIPEGSLSIKSVQAMFQKHAKSNFASFYGVLKCGNLSSQIILSPVPQPYCKNNDFESVKRSISDTIEIIGFLDVSDVGSPMAYSRHLVLPITTGKGESVSGVKVEADSEDESTVDDSKVPSFCVLLHGALKVENMVALCLLAEEWYGIMYSWAGSKKKSNLMLTVFEPGVNVVPWLGELDRLVPVMAVNVMALHFQKILNISVRTVGTVTALVTMTQQEENSEAQEEIFVDHSSLKDTQDMRSDEHNTVSKDSTNDSVILDVSCPPPSRKKSKTSSKLKTIRHQLLLEYQKSSRERMEMIRKIAAHKTASISHSDPIEDFFRGIITTVKTLPPNLQLQAKRSISNVVFDLEQQALSTNLAIMVSRTSALSSTSQ